MNGGYSAL